MNPPPRLKYIKPRPRDRRSFSRTGERKNIRLTRGRVMAILLVSALVGVLIGWGLGTVINKALRIRKYQVGSPGSWREMSAPPQSSGEESDN